MEALITLIFIGIFLFVVGRIATRFARQDNFLKVLKARFSAMEVKKSMASRLGFARPKVQFDYGRTKCKLIQARSGFRNKARFTEFRMDWADVNLTLNLSIAEKSSDSVALVDKTVAFEDSPEFEAAYNIWANNPDEARRLLSSNVQWKIQQLDKHCYKKQFTFSIRNGLIRIRCNGWFKKPADLEDFIQHSLELFDQMMLVDAKGLEFLHANQAAVIQNVKCPICSDEIMQEMVVCQRCKTPHCLDCWDYNGKCATFACNETRYFRTNSQVVEN